MTIRDSAYMLLFYVVIKATVKIESLKKIIFSLLLKAFKIKSTLRFNLNHCFYYNIYAVILITICKPDLTISGSLHHPFSSI